MSMYEVLAEFVEHNTSASHKAASECGAHEIVDSHTWLRAQHLISYMGGIGIDPMEQHIEPLVHILMATVGPFDGATFLF